MHATLRSGLVLLTMVLGLGQTACLKRMAINTQAKATREGSVALDEIGDYYLARTAAQNGLAQMEGIHYLAKTNEDVLFMLTRSWTSYGFAFAQDDMELAEEGSEVYEESKKRALFAFERSVKYGLELLGRHADGFDEAHKSEARLNAWLKDNFDSKKDVPALFWTGYGWLARSSLLRDRPEMVAELYVGVAMLRRAVELDPEYNHYNGYTALASYHARAKLAELDEAKRLFDLAIQKTERKSLLALVSYAERYACNAGDRALYDKLINEVLDFDEATAPAYRLTNTIAKRRAKRAARKDALQICGFDPNQPVIKKSSGVDDGEVSLDDFLSAGGDAQPEPTPAAEPTPEPAAAAPAKEPATKPAAAKPAAKPAAPKAAPTKP